MPFHFVWTAFLLWLGLAWLPVVLGHTCLTGVCYIAEIDTVAVVTELCAGDLKAWNKARKQRFLKSHSSALDAESLDFWDAET